MAVNPTVDAGSTVSRIALDRGLINPLKMAECLTVWRAMGNQANLDTMCEILARDAGVDAGQLEEIKQLAVRQIQEQTIPGFEILGKIGAGGAGAVYRARQTSLQRVVAIKVLLDKLAKDEKFTKKLFAEARHAAKLNHPNIVQAYDVGQTPKFCYFVMELVEGTNVGQQIEANGAYSEDQALRIAIQIGEALRHIHANEMLHCDVKPRNILLTRDGVAKLADLGLARSMEQVGDGKAFGTPFYNSPEQIRGTGVDFYTDVYSLGATLYHMVTGRVPFPGQSLIQVQQQHLSSALIPADHVNDKLSAGIGEIIEVMMAKEPTQRHASMEAVLEDFRAVLAGKPPVHARRASSVFELLAESETQAAPVYRRAGWRGYWSKASSVEKTLWMVLGASLAANIGLLFWVLSMLSSK